MKKINSRSLEDVSVYVAKIRKTAKSQLKATHEDWLDDVTQDVLIKVLQKINTYDEGKGSVEGWICTITKNHCKDLKNKKDNLLKSELSEIHLQGEPDEDKKEVGLRRRYVRRSLARLNELDRQLVTLRYFFDMSGREMAKLLNLPENQIPSRLQRAKNRLRLLLETGRTGGL